ncbi:hypothetical protein R5M92_08630 [Halomonas sp. Bachu 37]|uniref:hypothetical protein n=1 Tax=Halomonas kashgarensis TaxID=3084920 RepID=UPI003216369B
MRYTEAKEHTQGRLHELFADPYHAFRNNADERQLHIRIMLHLLVARPMQRGHLTLRVIHGWQNGVFDPEALHNADYPLTCVEDLEAAMHAFRAATASGRDFPSDGASLLAEPLARALAKAEAKGENVDISTRTIPARWPAFEGGLTLYTFFKMYHRLVYGEDDTYRCAHCLTSQGMRELHEFHLEEGEFAVVIPPGPDYKSEDSVLVMHESQLVPMAKLLLESIPLLENF